MIYEQCYKHLTSEFYEIVLMLHKMQSSSMISSKWSFTYTLNANILPT